MQTLEYLAHNYIQQHKVVVAHTLYYSLWADQAVI
jgi:hypothetical protein